MTASSFGIDFGTTNSLASVVVGNKIQSLVDQGSNGPHPSVIWYRGSDVVVGRAAYENMDLSETGAPPGFVRSPKMSLHRDGPIYVDGRPIQPVDAIAEVLGHLKRDAAKGREHASGYEINSAVMTIPVAFGGQERRILRQAARKAGFGVIQFVHEPVAALYAYLRAQPDIAQEMTRLEGRSILVFDWGGGTLDLTLCRIQGGSIMQVANLGDNEVGGDRFDDRIRNFVRAKHAAAHNINDITVFEQPGMSAKLLHQCENIKKRLSKHIDGDVFIKNYLKCNDPSQHLIVKVTRAELEKEGSSLVVRGLSRIDEILERARLSYQDIELCLATGGMVNMPAIQDGLTERFVGRVPKLENGDRIIAEGAAWIAHDGLRLTLSKPIEILIADSSGTGTYHPLVNAGFELPVENITLNVTNTRLFCTDPREGEAVVEIAKPVKLGRTSPSDPRNTLCIAKVPVDSRAEPLLERIECHLQIDHDYIVHLTLKSTGRGVETTVEFHDLEFGLSLLEDDSDDGEGEDNKEKKTRSAKIRASSNANLVQRSNVAVLHGMYKARDDLWKLVPGDLVFNWRPHFFAQESGRSSDRQQHERNFYQPCAWCKRKISQIKAEGRVPQCHDRCQTA